MIFQKKQVLSTQVLQIDEQMFKIWKLAIYISLLMNPILHKETVTENKHFYNVLICVFHLVWWQDGPLISSIQYSRRHGDLRIRWLSDNDVWAKLLETMDRPYLIFLRGHWNH